MPVRTRTTHGFHPRHEQKAPTTIYTLAQQFKLGRVTIIKG